MDQCKDFWEGHKGVQACGATLDKHFSLGPGLLMGTTREYVVAGASDLAIVSM